MTTDTHMPKLWVQYDAMHQQHNLYIVGFRGGVDIPVRFTLGWSLGLWRPREPYLCSIYISHTHNLNHVSADYVTFSRLSLDLSLSLSLRCTLALCSYLTLCLCSWLIHKIQRKYFVMMFYLTGGAANTGLAIAANTYQSVLTLR